MCCFFNQKTSYVMRISDWSSDVCSSDLDRMDLGLGIGIDIGKRRHADGTAHVEHARRLEIREAGFQESGARLALVVAQGAVAPHHEDEAAEIRARARPQDRKSTRLNSSH